VRRDGSLVPGDAGGGVALLAEMRVTRPIARALQTINASRYIDSLDKLVARHRGGLGRFVPEGRAPRRYP
jgi:hypothetical protein